MSARAIAEELVALARADRDLRASLASTGELFAAYHPKMRALHERNAAELLRIIGQIGWPAAALVGDEAASAAWMIAQHAISRPSLMRAARDAIAAAGPGPRFAHLEDRIAVLEGRPQIYGTQFEWNEDGELAPAPIADPETVDARRAAIGLDPLPARLAAIRKAAADEGERAPRDLKAYRAAHDAFAREVGWRP